jgi:heptaprenylglyceryl phosphate synthase
MGKELENGYGVCNEEARVGSHGVAKGDPYVPHAITGSASLGTDAMSGSFLYRAEFTL